MVFSCSFLSKMLQSGKAGTWTQKSGKGGTEAKKVWEPLLYCKQVIMIDNQ